MMIPGLRSVSGLRAEARTMLVRVLPLGVLSPAPLF